MGYPYHYRDNRTDTIMDAAFKIVSKEDLYQNTGIQFAQFNTLFQLLAETKRVFNQLNYADKMLLVPDFLNFMLSGEKKAEFTIISTTSLADPKSRFFKAGEMPEKIQAYLLETCQIVKSDAGFIVRVVLESLAYVYRKTIEEIEEITGVKIEILHAVGGGIQNELLTQLTADAIGRRVVAGPVEGTIIGNIGVVAIASGEVENLAEWRKIVAGSFDVKSYEPVNSEYFNKNESNYKKILMTDIS